MNINFEEVKKRLINDGDYTKGDIHQALMNICYEEWQEHDAALEEECKQIQQQSEALGPWTDENREAKSSLQHAFKVTRDKMWSYADFLTFVTEKFGDGVAFAILAGKFNQQVTNGGIIQFYDNGYGDGDGGCLKEHDPEMPLLQDLIFMIDKSYLGTTKIGDAIAELLSKIEVVVDDAKEVMVEEECCSCRGTGYNEENECMCSDCEGKGFIREEVPNDDYGCVCNEKFLSLLDSKYYEINEEWMALLNKFFTLWLEYEVMPTPRDKAEELIASGKYKKVS